MIHIIEGRIGAGKTYWIVCYILERFFKYDGRFFEWFPRWDGIKRPIYTNIKGLKLPDVHDIVEEVKKKGLEGFFHCSKEGDLLNPDLQNAIIIIDEAQGPMWFPRKYYNPAVILFFQLHRHFGCEVFLATQDVKTLCPDLRELPEYHLRVARQSLTLGPYFRYQKFFDDEPGPRTTLKKSQEVFDVYKSVEKNAELIKVPSVLMRYVAILGVALVVLFFAFQAFRSIFFGGKKAVASTVNVVAPVPLPVAAPVPVLAPAAVKRPSPAAIKKPQKWEITGQVQSGNKNAYVVRCGESVRMITALYLAKYCNCEPARGVVIGDSFFIDEKDLYRI